MSDGKDPQGPGPGGPNPWIKSLMVWGGIFLALLLVVSMFGQAGQVPGKSMGYSEFRTAVAAGTVKDVQIAQDKITGTMKNGDTFATVPISGDTELPKLLDERSEEHTSELQSRLHLVCRLLLEKKKEQTDSRSVVRI